MSSKFMPRMVNFEITDYRIIKDCALEQDFGPRSFSATVRFIIRDWVRLRLLELRQSPVAPISFSEPHT